MLEFTYCECGCKGSESLMIGQTVFWLYDDLQGNVFLHEGHGHLSPLIKKCSSHKEAVKLATDKAKELLTQEQENLDKICRQLFPKKEKPKSFDVVLLETFAGPANVTFRRLVRRCKTAQQIRDLASTPMVTEDGKSKLLLLAKAFKRRPWRK